MSIRDKVKVVLEHKLLKKHMVKQDLLLQQELSNLQELYLGTEL